MRRPSWLRRIFLYVCRKARDDSCPLSKVDRMDVFTLLSNKGVLCFVAKWRNVICLLLTSSKEFIWFSIEAYLLLHSCRNTKKKINTPFRCPVLLKQNRFKVLDQSLFFVWSTISQHFWHILFRGFISRNQNVFKLSCHRWMVSSKSSKISKRNNGLLATQKILLSPGLMA